MPSPEEPLTGECACGTVRFEVTKPFNTAGYCHCKRCQRRTGALWSENAIVDSDGFRFTAGEDAVLTWTPDGGLPKSFCGECGGHVTGGPPGGGFVVVRLGCVDGDPGIRPEWHTWVSSAPGWEALPDDGLPRFEQGRSR
jgi:hypothetical protein